MDGGSKRKGVIKHRLLLTSNQAKHYLLRAHSWSWSWSTKMVEYTLFGEQRVPSYFNGVEMHGRGYFDFQIYSFPSTFHFRGTSVPFDCQMHFFAHPIVGVHARKGIFLQNIAHLEFSQPSSIFIFQFCFSRQSTKYFVFLYLVFLQHSTRYFFCWNWLGCSKLSKVCGQQGERKTNFPRDDGPWRKVFHLKNIFHLPLGHNNGKT